MLIDGRTIPQATTLATDICIVGAGAAGLTLAQAFEGSAISVMLIESGGFGSEPDTQALAEGTAEEKPYPFTDSRARRFGGSTTRWSGACLPLDAGDFQRQAWLPHSGWPITLADLQPYYHQARQVFGLPSQLPPILVSPFHQSPIDSKQVVFSNPLDLGRKYRQQIVRSRNITLVTYANVTELIADADGHRVCRLDIRSLSGCRYVVAPQTVILATGGIENARLLLASNRHCPQGLGNHCDRVGRFFMEHSLRSVGILPLQQTIQAARFFTDIRMLGRSCSQGTFGLTDKVRSQQQLLNLHFRGYRYSPLEDDPSVIVAKQIPAAVMHQGDLALAASLLASLGKRQPSSWSVLPRYAAWHIWNKINRKARFTHMRLQAWIEQAPDPHNRITLSVQKDALGQPLAHLRLRFGQRMQDSVVRSLQLLDQSLCDHGLGSLQYSAEQLQHLTTYDKIGLHHMGTTRMHESPKQGVVDANCKVHGIANLYIAGSSVFPTGGASNPTLTIAAIALRLADHLRHNNKGESA